VGVISAKSPKIGEFRRYLPGESATILADEFPKYPAERRVTSSTETNCHLICPLLLTGPENGLTGK